MKTETKHTPIPWSVEKNNHRMRIVNRIGNPGEPGFRYRHVTRDWLEQKSGAKRGSSPSWYGFIPQEEIDAQRIVTCVNACDGMADPVGQIAELVLFAEKVARSACLKQENGNRCICFACLANELISKHSV